MQLICCSLLSENSTAPIIEFHSIKSALPALHALFQCKDKETMRQEADRLSFPLISLLLLRVGSEETELQDFYVDWLRRASEQDARLN
jgi:hypothetical protein